MKIVSKTCENSKKKKCRNSEKVFGLGSLGPYVYISVLVSMYVPLIPDGNWKRFLLNIFTIDIFKQTPGKIVLVHRFHPKKLDMKTLFITRQK